MDQIAKYWLILRSKTAEKSKLKHFYRKNMLISMENLTFRGLSQLPFELTSG